MTYLNHWTPPEIVIFTNGLMKVDRFYLALADLSKVNLICRMVKIPKFHGDRPGLPKGSLLTNQMDLKSQIRC